MTTPKKKPKVIVLTAYMPKTTVIEVHTKPAIRSKRPLEEGKRGGVG